ncbi:MAG: SDR family oxidoreductase [Gemmatimonadaceae bacterium]|nr:SDR family oxidoreductase [Gemmatimonadaceae bacterium]MCW5827485.1 SDR family oxidoreductase [Gemmatimonadaceae bacterium]
MRVAVIGGSGLVGAQLIATLRRHGHDAVAASRATGVNSVSGVGLAGAVAAARVVADVTNPPSFDDHAVLTFFEASARNVAAASLAAGVGHLVLLSVVGTDRLGDSAYFRAKMVQENAVRASGVPYTIVRATQFFEFAAGIAQSASDGNTVRVPVATVQPIASRDVAAALAEIIAGPPANGLLELAGPERMALEDFVRRSLSARGDHRVVTTDPYARYYGRTVAAHWSVCSRSPRYINATAFRCQHPESAHSRAASSLRTYSASSCSG